MKAAGDRKLLVLDGASVQRALPMAECIEIIDRTMRTVSKGGAKLPLRTVMPLPQAGNVFGVMPGYLDEPRVLGAKIVAVYPGNPERGLSTHTGVVVVFDAESGQPVALLDAAQVTAIRTAAASAVATRALMRADAQSLAILGTGEQATMHLRAMLEVARFRAISVWGRSVEKARAFAEREGSRSGVEIAVAGSVREAAATSDVICTTTASFEPILLGAWLRPGTHVNLVGASVASAREADDDVVRRSRFFVDFRDSALAQAGELRHAIASGLVGEDHIRGEIGDVLNGTAKGRESAADITVYKSLGIAAQDLAAAHAIYERALAQGLGTHAPF